MTINEYQQLAMRTVNPDLDKKQMLINSVMGLCGESGEAIYRDIVLAHVRYGMRNVSVQEENISHLEAHVVAVHRMADLARKHYHDFDVGMAMKRCGRISRVGQNYDVAPALCESFIADDKAVF